MRRSRLYLDPAEFGQLASRLKTGSGDDKALFDLNGAPAHYLASVLRVRKGDVLELFDGDGLNYEAVIEDVAKRRVSIRLLDDKPAAPPSNCKITLAQAISRGDRMDFVVQKATELGVQRIVPLLTARCEVKLDESRRMKRLKHWQQIAISAAEQSGRAELPEIAFIMTLDDWLAQRALEDIDQGFILHPEGAAGLNPFHGIGKDCSSVSLLIGPEGGFEADELAKATDAGLRSWQLGPRILRTETAPLAAITLLQWQFGDLRPPIHV